MKKLVLAGLFLVFASQLAGQAPPAPSEPAFLGPLGATVSLGGKLTPSKWNRSLMMGASGTTTRLRSQSPGNKESSIPPAPERR